MLKLKLERANSECRDFDVLVAVKGDAVVDGEVYNREDPLVMIVDTRAFEANEPQRHGDFVRQRFFLSELLDMDDSEPLRLGRGLDRQLNAWSFDQLMRRLNQEFIDMKIVQLHEELRQVYRQLTNIANDMRHFVEKLDPVCQLMAERANKLQFARTRTVYRDSLVACESLVREDIDQLTIRRDHFFALRNSTGELQMAIEAERRRLQGEA